MISSHSTSRNFEQVIILRHSSQKLSKDFFQTSRNFFSLKIFWHDDFALHQHWTSMCETGLSYLSFSEHIIVKHTKTCIQTHKHTLSLSHILFHLHTHSFPLSPSLLPLSSFLSLFPPSSISISFPLSLPLCSTLFSLSFIYEHWNRRTLTLSHFFSSTNTFSHPPLHT